VECSRLALTKLSLETPQLLNVTIQMDFMGVLGTPPGNAPGPGTPYEEQLKYK
jgi:hypothetical protein